MREKAVRDKTVRISARDAKAIRAVIRLARSDIADPRMEWALVNDRRLKAMYVGPPHLWLAYHRTVRRAVESKND